MKPCRGDRPQRTTSTGTGLKRSTTVVVLSKNSYWTRQWSQASMTSYPAPCRASTSGGASAGFLEQRATYFLDAKQFGSVDCLQE
jgi:hypothetical protein